MSVAQDRAMARPDLGLIADVGAIWRSGHWRGLNSDRGSVPVMMRSSPGRPGEDALISISGKGVGASR